METMQNVLISTAKNARKECSYIYPENRIEKIRYVNKSLIDKMIQLCRDNNYIVEC